VAFFAIAVSGSFFILPFIHLFDHEGSDALRKCPRILSQIVRRVVVVCDLSARYCTKAAGCIRAFVVADKIRSLVEVSTAFGISCSLDIILCVSGWRCTAILLGYAASDAQSLLLGSLPSVLHDACFAHPYQGTRGILTYLNKLQSILRQTLHRAMLVKILKSGFRRLAVFTSPRLR
jgi:hypothetical protein